MTIRSETVELPGKVMYCNTCGARGPEAAWDDVDDVLEQAGMMGWKTGEDVDVCPKCQPKPKGKKAKR